MDSRFLDLIGGPSVLIFIGALVAAIGGFWAQIRQTRFEREIRQETEDSLKTITGGDSYCFMAIVDTARVSETALVIANNGEYPLYDIQVAIFDLSVFPKLKESVRQNNFQDLRELFPQPVRRWTINISNLSPHTVFSPSPIKIDPNKGIEYYIRLSARNGIVHQKYGLLFRDNGWVQARQIFKWDSVGKTYRLIEEKIDVQYPLDDQSHIKQETEKVLTTE